MSRFNHKKEYSVRDIVVRVLGILACTAVVVTFMPRTHQDSYEVKVGEPWREKDMIAEVDCPVLKSQEQMVVEQDSVRRNFDPYYSRNDGLADAQIDAFRAAAMKRGLPSQHMQRMSRLLQQAYSQGIIQHSELDGRLAYCDRIRIVRGTTSTRTDKAQLLTPLSAYEMIEKQIDTTQLAITVLHGLNLSQYIEANVTYDSLRSVTALHDQLQAIPTATGMIKTGERIVSRGDVVTEEVAQRIRSYQMARSTGRDEQIENYTTIAGQTLYVATIITLLVFFFDLFRRDYMSGIKTMALVATMVISFPLITYALVRHNAFSAYIVPYSMVPVFIRIFLDSRTAFMCHVGMVLLSAVAAPHPFTFAAVEIVTGLVAIFSLRELSERSQIFRAALLVTLVAALMHVALDLMQQPDLGSINWKDYVGVLVGGIVLVCGYPLLFPVEKLFHFTSNVTLVELSNINHPLLRHMTEVAPGTFQHSMQVANLAAEVALKIGAKSQLVRTGALYHDIGKTLNPAFFTENQRGANPHDQLTPGHSAKIIIDHVRDGLTLADQNRLPKVIKDFIATHHGCGQAKYFYITAKNQGMEPDPKDYTYPGPNPMTLEQAILMMADAIEAASRSLKEYTDQSVGDLVERIIDGQVQEGYFRQCPITFRDISDAKQVFKTKLRTIYHTRVEYPKEK